MNYFLFVDILEVHHDSIVNYVPVPLNYIYAHFKRGVFLNGYPKKSYFAFMDEKSYIGYI